MAWASLDRHGHYKSELSLRARLSAWSARMNQWMERAVIGARGTKQGAKGSSRERRRSHDQAIPKLPKGVLAEPVLAAVLDALVGGGFAMLQP